MTELDCLISAGREFQRVGAATAKLRLPKPMRDLVTIRDHVAGQKSVDLLQECMGESDHLDEMERDHVDTYNKAVGFWRWFAVEQDTNEITLEQGWYD
jgi:hypothetical protein